MTRPRIKACYFGEGEMGDRYERLAGALRWTAGLMCPEWDVDIRHVAPGAFVSAINNSGQEYNTRKLEHWVECVRDADDGERLLLIDGDMLINRPIDDVWDLDFDLAYTNRQSGRLPLNGGVVFLRVTQKTRAFMELWWETNVRFLGDAADHKPWRLRYAGINQAALGYMIEKADHGCRLRKLPCNEWNLCDIERFDPVSTRIVHIKDSLRRACLGMYPVPRPTPQLTAVLQLWRAASDAGTREVVDV